MKTTTIKPTTTLKLSLYITYEPNNTSKERLFLILNAAAEHLFDNGLLSQNTCAEVVDCTHEVSEVEY